jgi:cystathionine beta-lyase/cystathionine gamma-synthase
MGGAAIARADLIRPLRTDFRAMGVALDPHAAFLIQRGLKTYFVRYSAQCARAMRIAQLLAAHPLVARVHYPGLQDHPQHALAAAQMREFGTIVSADLKGGFAAGGCFAESLKLFALTSSLGSTESLVVAPQMMTGRDLTAEQLRASAVTEGTVRLSIGLEDEEDLVADVLQALDTARTRCG